MEIEALTAALDAAEAAVAAFAPTPEQLREEAAKAEALAKENGTPADFRCAETKLTESLSTCRHTPKTDWD